ncbi:hypothetical protein WOLCODRAFT_137501 [Wolfiporia cocos MD-104 SS10]|uniref:Uncharacterized protein n=1 Tax=Wolfiporia cocos (strain MD-104) TaxID=742152 RepID=A0A2H3JNY8_WOLCO|nr:hypothetical protein WOLCODRAFT_137501 [Wolfiporia cocos MD-104 SS10]
MQQGGGIGMFGQGPASGHGRGGGLGMNQMQMGNRGGYGGGRGNNMGNRGRGAPMGMNRGGGRGRGGGSYNNMGGGRGGGMGPNNSFRGHGSNRGFGNRDNRRGGSFNAGGSQGFSHGYQQQQQQQQHHHHHNHHQQNFNNNSSRGRGFSHSSRGGRHDQGPAHVPRDSASAVSASFSSGKKDESKRTLTEFKIVGIEIPELSWSWEPHKSADGSPVKTSATVNAEADVGGHDTVAATTAPAAGESAVKSETTTLLPPSPPSWLQIYFHTPVSDDDSHPISAQTSFSHASNSSFRKGKRKKLEDDDDADAEDGRRPPPPPPGMGAENGGTGAAPSAEYESADVVAGRDSVAPSVTETVSEGDWLMAAIGGDDGDGEQGDSSHAEHVEGYHDHDTDVEGEYGHGYDDSQGQGHDEYHMGDDENAQGFIHEQQSQDTSTAAEQGKMSIDAGVPDGAKGPEQPPIASASDAAMADAPHLGNDAAAGSTVNADHAVGSEIPQDANSHAPPEPSTSDPAPAPAVVPSVSPPMNGAADSSHDGGMQAPVEHATQETGAAVLAADAIDSNVAGSSAAENADEATDTLEPTQPADDYSQYVHDAFREASISSASHIAAPGTYSELSTSQTIGKAGKVASANRLSVTYAAGSRRIVIDADIVDKLKVTRADGRIEVHINMSQDETGAYKGILLEVYSDETTSYVPLETSESLEVDPAFPTLTKLTLPTQITMIARLDRERPLPEPRWVKSGDIQEFLRSMHGRMFWVAGDAASDGWEKKIEVADPDPAPTIWTILEAWAQNSSVGQSTERQRFLRTHMTETDNILEILLRLVRGERSGPAYPSPAPGLGSANIAAPLLSALSPGAAHGAQQTHVSLAVLAIFRIAVEFAKRAAGDAGRDEVVERVGEVIRALPSHLLYKSLDGIFKEWKVEKKGGR